MKPEPLLEPSTVDTPSGVPVIAFRVYRNYVVVIKGRETVADLYKLEIVYFDVIMGIRDDHANHSRITLTTLEENTLYAKFSKSEFCLESVAFLGHVVTGNGIKVDPQKISAVKDCPRPTSVTDIRSFLGLANYYRKFVEGNGSPKKVKTAAEIRLSEKYLAIRATKG
ncbi:uncharacterized mitochondrial protein AtMg00860-like [Lycium ferocissimum]|uniref:uncharacterized mitochondrial protein AtMg00860-like n=1 Tax=Lycium ferocissimum TaxID=112874 RepID=UPI002814B2EA|nr:uncharacterized mitochondrial protein AtMg00860-like [Lycium ferocissimum]